jgi:cytochrome b5
MTVSTNEKVYPADEVAKHTTKEDCWITVHGLVLKLDTALMNEHPGGAEAILALGGKDVTEDFEDIGHSEAAREWAEKYIAGTVEGADEDKLKRNPETGKLEMPKMADIQGDSPAFGIVPVILVLVAIIVGYVYFGGDATAAASGEL